MKKITITNPNGTISCFEAMPAGAADAGGVANAAGNATGDAAGDAEPTAVVIVIHGFGSCKESPTAQMMLEALPPEGYGAVGLDLPGHGTEESYETPLSIETCLDTIESVESYLIEKYDFPRIFYFASSFGAYLTLLYLSGRRHTGDKAFLRSAAVNMPQLFDEKKTTLEGFPSAFSETIDRDGYIMVNDAGPAPVKVTRELVDGLAANDLFSVIPAAIDDGVFDGVDLEMIHGEKDETIDPAGALRFAAICDIPITVLEGEDHTLSTDPDSPKKVCAAAIEFFRE